MCQADKNEATNSRSMVQKGCIEIIHNQMQCDAKNVR